MILMYDEANPDLSEDIEDFQTEEEISEEEEEAQKKLEDEYDLHEYDNARKVSINKEFIKNELKIQVENYRHKINFTDGKNIYNGYIIAKLNENKSAWSVIDVSTNDKIRKSKIFETKKLKQLR